MAELLHGAACPGCGTPDSSRTTFYLFQSQSPAAVHRRNDAHEKAHLMILEKLHDGYGQTTPR
jgi:hypothetical protein